MPKFFRLLSIFSLSLVLLLLSFYFWASSSSYDQNTYSKIYENSFPANSNGDSIISIMSYNIGYLSGMTNNLAIEKPRSFYDQNLETVLDQLKKLSPDIIAFQEIDYASKRSYEVNQQNEIEKLGYRFVAQAVNWDKKYLPFPYFPVSMQFGKMLSGQSVLSKYKILDQERIELQRNETNPFYYDAFYIDRLAQVVSINVPGKTIVLINVHLEAYHQETRIEQTKKIIEIYNRYNKTHPTILLGDFNSDIHYDNASIYFLLNLPKTGNACFDKDQLKNTFNSEDPTERLDYIFYNTDFIELIDGKVLTNFKQASDHLPLMMNFKLK